MSSVTKTGVYYGYAQVSRQRDGKTVLPEEDGKVLPMVMSLGWNPFYKNERMSAVRSILSIRQCLLTALLRKSTSCMISKPTFTGTI